MPGTVKVRGGEIALGAAFTEALSGHVSFEANSSKEDGGEQLIRVPEQVGKADLDFHPTDLPIGVTLGVTYTGRVWTSVGPDLVPYGHFVVFDLSGRYMFGRDRKQRITVSVQNLLDRDYGTPNRGCMDVPTDRPYDCSVPYTYINRGLRYNRGVSLHLRFLAQSRGPGGSHSHNLCRNMVGPMLLWCLTGMVMMYTPYPQLTEAERVAHLSPPNLTGCRGVGRARARGPFTGSRWRCWADTGPAPAGERVRLACWN